MLNQNIDSLTINTIRVLSVDMVEKANSGHPGMPLGAAPIIYTLFANHMRYNGRSPKWVNRDRFVLSAGHGSAMLYSTLHLFGYDLTIEDLKSFRQFESRTPGHPEYGSTPGVEVSTGPLGQGIANAVGMALAESYLSKKFNRPGFPVIDHYTFALCGDGCLMQGISYEAASLAGTLKLGKLILLYDSNDITIEGSTKLAFAEDVGDRFRAMGWDTHKVINGNSLFALNQAIMQARTVRDKPSFIEVKTTIGFGAPNKAGKSVAHGEPLGEEELAKTKKYYDFDPEESFVIPQEVSEHMMNMFRKQAAYEKEWERLFEKYKEKYPDLYEEMEQWYSGRIPELIDDYTLWDGDPGMTTETRESSERVLNHLSGVIPNIIGGSADLGPSNKSVMRNRREYSFVTTDGSNIHFGAREHSMTAIANGMLVHGGLRPYVAEFFTFSDYMKPALRMAAMMKLPLIAILTHDSIAVGEDGPTHEPVEQLAALRSMPNMTVIRPADAKETSAAWYLALNRKNSPTALVLTRQKVPQLKVTGKGALNGGYTVIESSKEIPDIILIGTGSELSLACRAAETLKEKGVDVRVVSMPSFEVFEEQPQDYKDKVLPPAARKRLAVEAGSSFGWGRYVGLDGGTVSVETFGKSGKSDEVLSDFGYTVENVVDKAIEILNKR